MALVNNGFLIYGEKETTHRFPMLCIKQKIINILRDFVARPWGSREEKAKK